MTKAEDIIADMRRNPKGFRFQDLYKYAIPFSVRLDRKAAVTESMEHPGRSIRESTFKMAREWLKHIRSNKY